MTRINLVPPEELTDQHLFAEFREIKMVAKSLRRSIASAVKKYGADWEKHILSKISKQYTLNTGHVTFFYDKGTFLKKRFGLLCKELDKRGVNYNKQSTFDESDVYKELPNLWNKDYNPTPLEINISNDRIVTRIFEKPHFYKYNGKPYIKAYDSLTGVI